VSLKDSQNPLHPPILEARDISHSFEYQLFENINLKLYPKDSVAILGVSGSGKSTLLHILSTLLKPTSGEVEIFGENIYKKNQNELVKIRRDSIGIIFQAHYLFKGFSARENIEIARLLTGKDKSDEIEKSLGIEKLLEQNITELSGGQQQRVSIARVLAKGARIIFADEPTGNLDSQTAKEVMDKIFEYIDKVDGALFLVTHDENLAKRCKRVYKLESQNLIPV
jgi:putative ABC transport system ATP-binding protein